MQSSAVILDFEVDSSVQWSKEVISTSSNHLSDLLQPPTQKRVDPEQIHNETLRAMCENVLHLITTTISNMELVCLILNPTHCVIPTLNSAFTSVVSSFGGWSLLFQRYKLVLRPVWCFSVVGSISYSCKLCNHQRCVICVYLLLICICYDIME